MMTQVGTLHFQTLSTYPNDNLLSRWLTCVSWLPTNIDGFKKHTTSEAPSGYN
jgi:hypothetical protein